MDLLPGDLCPSGTIIAIDQKNLLIWESVRGRRCVRPRERFDNIVGQRAGFRID